jgi:hypothetical protein
VDVDERECEDLIFVMMTVFNVQVQAHIEKFSHPRELVVTPQPKKNKSTVGDQPKTCITNAMNAPYQNRQATSFAMSFIIGE